MEGNHFNFEIVSRYKYTQLPNIIIMHFMDAIHTIFS